MNHSKISMRVVALAGGLTLLAGSAAFAQEHEQKPRDQGTYNENVASRTVEGTVQSVTPDRDGQRVRLTNGTELLVPNSVTGTGQGHRYGASALQPGDDVRMNVDDRNGDNRDAEVRSMEIVQTHSVYNNDRRLDGTVMSFNRRGHSLMMREDNGQTVNVNLRGYNGRNNTSSTTFRRGQRISITGRVDHGVLIADDVRMINNRR